MQTEMIYLKLPALLLREALVHVEEVCCKQRCFLATCSGPDLQDDSSVVSPVLGEQQCQNVLLNLLYLWVHNLFQEKPGHHINFYAKKSMDGQPSLKGQVETDWHQASPKI